MDTAQLENAKNTFISIAAHKLLTPPTAISWNLELIRRKVASDPELTSYLDNISLNTSKLISFGNLLMKITNFQLEDKKETAESEIDLHKLISDVILILGNEFKLDKYKIKNRVPDESRFILKADEKSLKEMLLGILRNSFEYNQGDNEIIIGIEKTDKNKVQIKIKDTGIGIPESEIKYITTPFYRASNAKKVNTSGYGLDLYIAKLYLDSVGGSIEILNNQGSSGTTLVIEF